MSHIPRKVRDAVVARADGCCERCGRWAEGGSLHHRKLRSQGGRDTVANLVLLHGSGVTGCHGHVHQDRIDAAIEGFVVPAWEDPAEVSVVVHGYGRVRLSADGGYVPVAVAAGEQVSP